MPAIVDQLDLLQIQRLQNLLTGSVHNVQLLVAVHQNQGPTADPLQTGVEHLRLSVNMIGSHRRVGTHTQADDVTAQVELSLLDDVDGARLLLLYLSR